jgi:hypothetical protein
MTSIDIDLHPVDNILIDALGQPECVSSGWQESTITLIIEKLQLQTLAVGIEQFLAEVQDKVEGLKEASAEYQEDQMHIHPPVDPLFRVGEFGLGYDAENDLMVLVARELMPEGTPEEEGSTLCAATSYAWHAGVSRSLLASANCPQCGEPMDRKDIFAQENGQNISSCFI